MSLSFTTRRRVAVLVLALVPLVAVTARSSGGENTASTPTLPSGLANVSGSWTGTTGWIQNDVHSIGSVLLSIDQDGRSVTGALTFTSPAYQGWGGAITGTVAGTPPDTQFVGTIELRTPSTTGTAGCAGTAVVSGRSAADSLRWDTSQLNIVSDADRQPASACRGTLRNFVLILGRN